MVICRMGAISQTSAVARNLPAQRRGCSIQSSRISRSGNPEASPRDTSSRSARVSASRERQRAAGEMPPRGNNKHRIELCGLSKARPISCSDCPAFHRLQILFFSTAENPNRFPSLMQHHLQRAALYQMVLRRLIETTRLIGNIRIVNDRVWCPSTVATAYRMSRQEAARARRSVFDSGAGAVDAHA